MPYFLSYMAIAYVWGIQYGLTKQFFFVSVKTDAFYSQHNLMLSSSFAIIIVIEYLTFMQYAQ